MLFIRYLTHIADPNSWNQDYFWFSCNCVNVMKASMQAAPDCMNEVMYSLLKAMNRIAKDHNQQPNNGYLFAKTNPREVPADSEYSTGPWFMYHALNSEFLSLSLHILLSPYNLYLSNYINHSAQMHKLTLANLNIYAVAVPSALVLSAEHRKMFLSTLVMLITGTCINYYLPAGYSDSDVFRICRAISAPGPDRCGHLIYCSSSDAWLVIVAKADAFDAQGASRIIAAACASRSTTCCPFCVESILGFSVLRLALHGHYN